MALSLIDSRTTVLEQPRIIQFGPPGCGKTVGAATYSDYFPQEIFKGEKPKEHVYLKDTMFVLFDKGGLDSLAPWRVSAPILPWRNGEKQIAKDHSGVSGGAVLQAIEQIGKDVAEAVEKLGIKIVVFDTFSTLDAVISAYCQQKFSDEKDNRRVWGQVLGIHLRLVELMRPVNATVIYNCHAKDNAEANDKEKDKQEATRRAAGINLNGTIIVPEITGRSFRIYNGACSLVLPLTANRRKEGGKWITDRCYHPAGYQGLQSKNRFQSLLGETEPVNGKALLEKIRQNIGLLDAEDKAFAQALEAQGDA